MILSLNRLRLTFQALDLIRFPAGKPANILRGALGAAFRKTVCMPECSDSRRCSRRDDCIYARVFEPRATRAGPSGLADSPRPFVFRAGHLDGMVIAAGQRFHFDVNLFDTEEQLARTFSDVFAAIALVGIGAGRGRAELVASACVPLQIDLAPGAARITRVLVRFLTPTELKDGNALTNRPEFAVLFARARDRVSSLSALYGPGPLDLDFKGMGERAALIRMTRCDLWKIEAFRRSSRTGQEHPLGGFIGEAEYEGELAEFVPFLEAAQFTGVGRQTVWGKGQVDVSAGAPG